MKEEEEALGTNKYGPRVVGLFLNSSRTMGFRGKHVTRNHEKMYGN